MKRMIDDNNLKGLSKIKDDIYGNIIINDGLEVEDNGDVTVGRDLYIEDEIIISALHKIVGTDGLPLIQSTGLSTGSYNIKLVVDAQGCARIEVIQ